MNYLDKLLEGETIEWKTIGDIGPARMCKRILKKQTAGSGDIPFFKIGTFGKKPNAFIPLDLYNEYKSKYNFPKIGDILISASGTIGRTVIFDGEDAYFQDSNIVWVENDENLVLNKYLFHFYKIAKWAIAEGGIIKRLYNDNLLKTKIPVPCPDNPQKSLKIQKEIVRILDTFSELTAELTTELTTELTARKKQYSYYREQLLTFDKDAVEHLPMDDENLGEFIRGKRFVKTDMISEGVPCIHYGEMYTHYDTWAEKAKSYVSKELVERKKLRCAEKGDVVIVAAGETIEEIGQGTAWLGEEGVVIHDACFYYKSTLNPKYVAYFTRTRQFHDQIKKHIRTGKISAINAKGLGKAIIPIPSPEEQERIVNILDKFNILTTSISVSLPKEIELRKKQYEYYRKKLFTFPKDTIEA